MCYRPEISLGSSLESSQRSYSSLVDIQLLKQLQSDLLVPNVAESVLQTSVSIATADRKTDTLAVQRHQNQLTTASMRANIAIITDRSSD